MENLGDYRQLVKDRSSSHMAGCQHLNDCPAGDVGGRVENNDESGIICCPENDDVHRLTI